MIFFSHILNSRLDLYLKLKEREERVKKRYVLGTIKTQMKWCYNLKNSVMQDCCFFVISDISYVFYISVTFFSLFSLSPWKKQHDHRTLKDWWTLISASIITCVSDVKTSLSASTYPSSVKWTSGDSHLSLKSLSYVSRNLKWTLSSDWLYTCFSESIPNFLKQFLVKQISMLQ